MAVQERRRDLRRRWRAARFSWPLWDACGRAVSAVSCGHQRPRPHCERNCSSLMTMAGGRACGCSTQYALAASLQQDYPERACMLILLRWLSDTIPAEGPDARCGYRSPHCMPAGSVKTGHRHLKRIAATSGSGCAETAPRPAHLRLRSFNCRAVQGMRRGQVRYPDVYRACAAQATQLDVQRADLGL